MRSAVLLLIFNRPDTTERVFDALRKAKPPRLYVAADGPRATRAGEKKLCDASRRIATSVDWPCTVHTLLRDHNLGCKAAVSSAIDWFFANEKEGIILEDDCLPADQFFDFCDELLEYHRDNELVMCISGDNFIAERWQPAHSYYFSRYSHIWGWASWARAWQHYRVDLLSPGDAPMEDVLEQALPESAYLRRHWRLILTDVMAGRIDTWDYQWMYAVWRRGGLSCMPRVNLISNIGFGPSATHTTTAEHKLAGRQVGRLPNPLQHPPTLLRDAQADAWTERNVFGITRLRMLRRSVALFINGAREFQSVAWKTAIRLLQKARFG